MRRAALGVIGLLMFGAVLGAQAQKATEKDLVGVWAGRYDGGGGGGTFEMTVTKDAQGKLGRQRHAEGRLRRAVHRATDIRSVHGREGDDKVSGVFR